MAIGAKRQPKNDPVADSKDRQLQYEEQLKYLKSIEKNIWVPLPSFKEENIDRSLVVQNKNVGRDEIKIMFKRFINSDSSSYYITWSFNFP